MDALSNNIAYQIRDCFYSRTSVSTAQVKQFVRTLPEFQGRFLSEAIGTIRKEFARVRHALIVVHESNCLVAALYR